MKNKNIKQYVPAIGLIIIAFAFFIFLFVGLLRGASLNPLPERQLNTQTSSDPLVTKVSTTQLTAPLIGTTDPIRGNPTSPVTIVEFSDFACPYCRLMAQNLSQVLAKHPEAHLVWKDFPLTVLHSAAEGAHVAARCAQEQGKFWEYHDLLFSTTLPLSQQTFLALANKLALKENVFSICLDNPVTLAQVQADETEGNELGIDGTPFLFINDQRISGYLNADELERAINIHALIKTKQ